jgi:hypothetical protein
MPRSCVPCITGCNSCSSGTSCNTCASTFVRVSRVCVCNTTQNLFYNSNNNTCTSCSLAITNCTSCTGSGVTTTCNTCLTGSFVSGGICQPCSLYCSMHSLLEAGVESQRLRSYEGKDNDDYRIVDNDGKETSQLLLNTPATL